VEIEFQAERDAGKSPLSARLESIAVCQDQSIIQGGKDFHEPQ